jgi:hypothetical protein
MPISRVVSSPWSSSGAKGSQRDAIRSRPASTAASGRSGRPPRQHSPDQGVGLRAQLLPCSPSLVGPPPRLEVGCRRNRPLLVRHAAAAIGQQRLQELRTRLAWLYLRQPQALPAAGAGSGSRQRQLPPRYVRDHHDQVTRVARSRMVMPDARSSTSSSALIRRVSGLRRLQPRHRGFTSTGPCCGEYRLDQGSSPHTLRYRPPHGHQQQVLQGGMPNRRPEGLLQPRQPSGEEPAHAPPPWPAVQRLLG